MLAEVPPRCAELILALTVSGFFQALGCWLMQRAMRDGPHSLIWTLGQMALVVPFLANVLLWHEQMAITRFAGLALIAVGVFVLGKSKGASSQPRPSRNMWAVPAFLSFACIGISQALCTLPSHWPKWEDVAGLRVPLIMGTTGLGYLGLRMISPPRPRGGLLRFSIAGAAMTLVGGFLLFFAIDRLTSVQMIALAYPVAVGTGIVFFSLYGRIFLGETPSKLGLATTMAGLIAISC